MTLVNSEDILRLYTWKNLFKYHGIAFKGHVPFCLLERQECSFEKLLLKENKVTKFLHYCFLWHGYKMSSGST